MAQLPLSTALEQAERSDGTAMAKFPLSTAVEQAERSDGAAADQREVATPTQQETAGRGRSNGMRIKAGEHGRLRGSTRYLAGSRAEPNAGMRPFQRSCRKGRRKLMSRCASDSEGPESRTGRVTASPSCSPFENIAIA